jgi:hypothetical protein
MPGFDNPIAKYAPASTTILTMTAIFQKGNIRANDLMRKKTIVKLMRRNAMTNMKSKWERWYNGDRG